MHKKLQTNACLKGKVVPMKKQIKPSKVKNRFLTLRINMCIDAFITPHTQFV